MHSTPKIVIKKYYVPETSLVTVNHHPYLSKQRILKKLLLAISLFQ